LKLNPISQPDLSSSPKLKVAMWTNFMVLPRNPVDPELKAEFEDQQKNSPLAGMHNAIQAATGGGSASGAGVGGAGSFDLAGWMAGSGKSGQQGGTPTSGMEVREGAARRR
jgi:hypothetical protein